jgi:uncharacterized protein (DUF2267 family)
VSYRDFVEQVRTKSGSNDPAHLERAIAATIEALGERLRAPDAEAVARKLPPELARHLKPSRERTVAAEHAPDAVVSQVCSEAGVRAEELRAICRVLAETLDEQGRAQLRMQPLSSLFVH